jgi:hypothetical protein
MLSTAAPEVSPVEGAPQYPAPSKEPTVSYFRVIPRDLFNEASLLKCYGRLAILLDDMRSPLGRRST